MDLGNLAKMFVLPTPTKPQLYHLGETAYRLRTKGNGPIWGQVRGVFEGALEEGTSVSTPGEG